MIRRDTARNIITDLIRSCHPDEPVLILCVTANDLKQRLADEHPGQDCAEPGDDAIIAAMETVVRSMCRADEDSSLEDRIIDAMPTSGCDCCDRTLPTEQVSSGTINGDTLSICDECRKEAEDQRAEDERVYFRGLGL